MTDKTRVRIESNGRVGSDTHVLIDGHDVTNSVSAVTWHLGVDEEPATAVITFLDVQIDAEADAVDAPVAEQEFRAVDLTVLDVKPGDTILLRHELMVDQETCERLVATCQRAFPGHTIVVLDGGLELSVLRPESEPPASSRFATKDDREAFLTMFGDKLDAWFTPEFAAYVRGGPQPSQAAP